jgi:hypothetical protein
MKTRRKMNAHNCDTSAAAANGLRPTDEKRFIRRRLKSFSNGLKTPTDFGFISWVFLSVGDSRFFNRQRE